MVKMADTKINDNKEKEFENQEFELNTSIDDIENAPEDLEELASEPPTFDIDYDEEIEYFIVSSREVDPLHNKISDQSPIGKALMGTKVGDVVSVEVPDGMANFRIVNIAKS